ncbi:MAG: outer membrane protein transport protein [bacterium]|nr:outer membrane protein transport protein [bacterium]
MENTIIFRNSAGVHRHPTRPIFILSLLLGWAAGLIFSCPPVWASPLDVYGFTSRHAAMANTGTAFADDYSGVYYNPAALILAEYPAFGFGFIYSNPSLSVETTPEVKNKISPVKNLTGFPIGLVLPFSGKLKNRVSFGLGLFLTGDLNRTYFVSGYAPKTNYPQFIQVDQRIYRTAINLGIAVRPIRFLSLGIGVHLIPNSPGKMYIKMDANNYSGGGNPPEAYLNFNWKYHISPTAGLLLELHPRWKIGLAFRDEVDTLLDIPVDTVITLLGIDERLKIPLKAHMDYTPRQLALGASFQALPSLKTALDLTWVAWSRFPSPSGEMQIEETQGIPLPLEEIQKNLPRNPDPDFHDTLVPALSAEWSVRKDLRIRGGYSFIPTPVYDQSSRETNFLDSSRHLLTFGMGVSYQDPFGIFPRPVSLDLHLQEHIFQNRKTVKSDPGNPGYPDYEIGGSILSGGVSFRMEL